MARVVVVHGIGQEFLGPELMCQQVGPALRDGVRLASGLVLSAADVSCAFYGDVFFEPGSRLADLPPWDESDVDDELELELLDVWYQQVAALGPALDLEADGTRGAFGWLASRPLRLQWVRNRLDALTRHRFFAKALDRLLILALKQVRRYLTESEIRTAAQSRVVAEVGAETRTVVAHSLGSVVAYEALCAHPEWPVTDLVTLGSPLGLRSIIFDRLVPEPVDGLGAWPGSVVRWTNIADPSDIVALVHPLVGHFEGSVMDDQITNGVRMHDLLRYLTAPKTGTAVAAGLIDASASNS